MRRALALQSESGQVRYGYAAFRFTPRYSKYAEAEGFADRRDGRVMQQDHGDDVWFRNLKVREYSAQ